MLYKDWFYGLAYDGYIFKRIAQDFVNKGLSRCHSCDKIVGLLPMSTLKANARKSLEFLVMECGLCIDDVLFDANRCEIMLSFVGRDVPPQSLIMTFNISAYDNDGYLRHNLSLDDVGVTEQQFWTSVLSTPLQLEIPQIVEEERKGVLLKSAAIESQEEPQLLLWQGRLYDMNCSSDRMELGISLIVSGDT